MKEREGQSDRENERDREKVAGTWTVSAERRLRPRRCRPDGAFGREGGRSDLGNKAHAFKWGK